MAVEPEADELLLDNEAEGGNAEAEEGEGQGSEESGDEGEEELEVTFGDEAAPASGERDTDLVKHLREEIRRRDKELAETRRNLPAPQKIEVGPKPDFWEDCEGDPDRYDAAMDAWRAQQAEAQRAETQAEAADREAKEDWQSHLTNYQSRRAELKFADVDDAEELARARLDQVQQAAIVVAAENPALVLYSLGKHPAKLAELSQIKNPLKLAAAVAKLEGTLKVTTRRKAPDPEEIAHGTATVTQGKDKELERLEKKAAQSGDRTELIRYKASLKTPAK